MLKTIDTRNWFARKFRPYDWSKSEELYEEFQKILQHKKLDYDACQELLTHRWPDVSATMPAFPETQQLDKTAFSNPEEAEAILSDALQYVRKYDPWSIESSIEMELSAEFIAELKKNAPADDTLLVFVSSYKPYEFNIARFWSSVEDHKEAFISIMGIVPAWAAIFPDTKIDACFCPEDFKGYF